MLEIANALDVGRRYKWSISETDHCHSVNQVSQVPGIISLYVPQLGSTDAKRFINNSKNKMCLQIFRPCFGAPL